MSVALTIANEQNYFNAVLLDELFEVGLEVIAEWKKKHTLS